MTRRGVSLISLLIVITILSGFMIVFGVLLRSLMLTESRAAGQIVELRRWEDLMVQFRRDVHAADSSELTAEASGQSLKLGPDDIRIEYLVTRDRVERKAATGRAEIWKFPDQALTLARDPDGRWLTLEVSGLPASRRDDPHPAARTRTRTLEAEVGRMRSRSIPDEGSTP